MDFSGYCKMAVSNIKKVDFLIDSFFKIAAGKLLFSITRKSDRLEIIIIVSFILA
jgi:hypothetical protein